MDFLGIHNLFQSVYISELTVRVVGTVPVILLSNFSEMLKFSSIPIHVILPCISKKSWSKWSSGSPFHLDIPYQEFLEWV